MKEVCLIMQEEGDENTVKEYAGHIADLLSEEVTDADKNIVFYVAGFIAHSLKKKALSAKNVSTLLVGTRKLGSISMVLMKEVPLL